MKFIEIVYFQVVSFSNLISQNLEFVFKFLSFYKIENIFLRHFTNEIFQLEEAHFFRSSAEQRGSRNEKWMMKTRGKTHWEFQVDSCWIFFFLSSSSYLPRKMKSNTKDMITKDINCQTLEVELERWYDELVSWGMRERASESGIIHEKVGEKLSRKSDEHTVKIRVERYVKLNKTGRSMKLGYAGKSAPR